MSQGNSFAVLKGAGRIWAIGSIHGEANRLQILHDLLATRLQPNDRLIYLGNYLGYGPDVIGTVNEIVSFRRAFLARPPFTNVSDFVLLRGSQEEMWQKVLQLQSAIDPIEVMTWMAERGLAATLSAYARNNNQGILDQHTSALTIAQWTSSIRDAMQAIPGHVPFMNALKRAAYTVDESLLFVNTGIDISRPVTEQSDVFWWASKSFARITSPYRNFTRVVRGYDPDHGGFAETEFTMTVDGGCGFGGPLVAVCLELDGTILDRLQS